MRKRSPRYKVLLHNDPVNTMEYVVSTLQQVVPQLSEQDAMAVMLEAHNTGVGLVIVCDLEPAEFYCETLKAKGLTSTMEPEELSSLVFWPSVDSAGSANAGAGFPPSLLRGALRTGLAGDATGGAPGASPAHRQP